MGLLGRGLVFLVVTTANAILFLFHARVLLPVVEIANSFGTGPASSAINSLPIAVQLGMGILQLGVTLFFIGGLGSERTAARGPV